MEPSQVFGVTAVRAGPDDEAGRNAARRGSGAGRVFAATEASTSEPIP